VPAPRREAPGQTRARLNHRLTIVRDNDAAGRTTPPAVLAEITVLARRLDDMDTVQEYEARLRAAMRPKLTC